MPHDALEPSIDARTMEIHHGKHHAAYVANLNVALEGKADLEGKKHRGSSRKIWMLFPEDIRGAVRNNGGGHWNHSFFWTVMGPECRRMSRQANLAELPSNGAFGSLDGFKEQFTKAGMTRFGSGWAWLSPKDAQRWTRYLLKPQSGQPADGWFWHHRSSDSMSGNTPTT